MQLCRAQGGGWERPQSCDPGSVGLQEGLVEALRAARAWGCAKRHVLDVSGGDGILGSRQLQRVPWADKTHKWALPASESLCCAMNSIRTSGWELSSDPNTATAP